MASPFPSSFFPSLFLLLSLFSAATCQTPIPTVPTCFEQMDNLTGNKVLRNCIDLPALDSYLHWTRDAKNSSLSVAFAAAPPSPGGWVAWGINPKGEGMVGAQVLAAYRDGGAVTVKTLDLKSYGQIVPGKLSFEVWDVRAEEVGGMVRIYATVEMPQETEAVNHVWQVGPSVTAGRIGRHEFSPANLKAKGRLSITGGHDSGDGGSSASDGHTGKKFVSLNFIDQRGFYHFSS